jgi:mono/diheme cytochrome c family protein
MNCCRALSLVLTCAASAAAADVDYLRDVKPILAQKCFACHGALKQESGLRVDTAGTIRAGGESGAAIVPGKPAESLLLKRVSAPDAETRMPPEGEGEKLDERQLAILKTWIEQGAQAPDEQLPPDPRSHWSFQPPVRPAVPTVRRTDWVQNPIDAFIAANHEQKGLTPVEPAPKHVLLRRVYLDLIGLPPTTDELQAFLADESPNAYEKVVQNLLDRPEYGQRWGRHWMDVWRYSDWAGYKQEVRESQRHIWRWRDWIIESLNADKGYDQMVREMLAGDELAPGDPDVLRATGFLVRNRHASNRNIWLDATVEHTAKAFLGLTINCARCHDHKYDPIPQISYYNMRAIFEAYDVSVDRLPGQTDLLKEGLVRVFDGKPQEPTYLYIRGNEKQPDKEHPVEPGLPAVLASEFEVQPVSLPLNAWHPGLRPDFQEEDLAAARKAIEQAEAALKKAQEAAKKTADASDVRPPAVALAEAKLHTTQAELESLTARYAADFAKHQTPPAANFNELAVNAAKIERQAALCKADLALLQAEEALTKAKQAKDPMEAKAKAALTKAEKDHKAAQETREKAQAAVDKTDGSYTSVSKPFPETSTGRRLALAKWITQNDNPLAARVAVNHIWLRHFGAALVDNVFDFGIRSPKPELGDLLDWLSVELVEHSWRMKHLHKLMVTSSTYRLSSNPAPVSSVGTSAGIPARTPNPSSLDPDNRALWHMNTRRLEAELVRDCILFVGGSLDCSLGGPDIDFQLGESSKRRSVYFRHAYEKQMQFLVLFDAANVNECYRRTDSVIPQQALAVANSPLSLTQSRLLARKLSGTSASTPDFVKSAFEHILSRQPLADEQTTCEKFIADQSARLTEPEKLTSFPGDKKAEVPPAADAGQRARESLIHVLLNHNDFVTIR